MADSQKTFGKFSEKSEKEREQLIQKANTIGLLSEQNVGETGEKRKPEVSKVVTTRRVKTKVFRKVKLRFRKEDLVGRALETTYT